MIRYTEKHYNSKEVDAMIQAYIDNNKLTDRTTLAYLKAQLLIGMQRGTDAAFLDNEENPRAFLWMKTYMGGSIKETASICKALYCDQEILDEAKATEMIEFMRGIASERGAQGIYFSEYADDTGKRFSDLIDDSVFVKQEVAYRLK